MDSKLNRRSLFGWIAGLFVAGPVAKLWAKPALDYRHTASYVITMMEGWTNTVSTRGITFENVWEAIDHFKAERKALIEDTSFGDSFRD